MALHESLLSYVEKNLLDFSSISDERKTLLLQLTDYVRSKNDAVLLNFICTHNSRRSHIAQLWAQAAAVYYHVSGVTCYSGGTEATAFNPRAVKAMRGAGFHISTADQTDNPVYAVSLDSGPAISVFSKTFDAPGNPTSGFCAVMTCSQADEHCPFIPGAEKRIPLTYDDPKDFDGTELEAAKYAERVKQIGTELFFAFSRARQ